MNGELSWEEFLVLMDDFLEISNGIGDGWALFGEKNVFGGAYAVKREERSGKSVENSNLNSDLEETNLEKILEDNSVVETEKNENKGRQFWEYHIVYSVSYSVPVLYFNAWRDSGELLTLEEIWNEIPPSMKPDAEDKYWSLISQQEHPLLGKPFFQIHPCQTANLISAIKGIAGERIFIPWLSTVGPLVNLSLSPLYASKNAKQIE
ncbi:hypothetical protein J437_LFUL003800 [Ladona fulva]|uniref:Ubiquitin-like-conjugating enzyme ATG10 n=1 Tax=Ladona fulva TaxID=123851 RepID=A0A8K0JZL7_LADFU|nr:hypothetical protein J437_LFUL003800 [Ladona fulva]